MHLKSLSTDQIALFSEYRQKWLDIGLDCSPLGKGDRLGEDGGLVALIHGKGKFILREKREKSAWRENR